jgi:hypothetical protein
VRLTFTAIVFVAIAADAGAQSWDTLDDLLDNASPGQSHAPRSRPLEIEARTFWSPVELALAIGRWAVPDDQLPRQLSRTEIVSGMKARKRKLQKDALDSRIDAEQIRRLLSPEKPLLFERFPRNRIGDFPGHETDPKAFDLPDLDVSPRLPPEFVPGR